MKILETSRLTDIIRNQYEVDLQLRQGNYRQYQLNNISYISYSSRDLNDDEAISQGKLIMEYRDRWYLLPSVLDLILGVEILQIGDTEQIVETTFGNTTMINQKTGNYLLKDGYNRIIALVKIEADQMIPLVDVGLYLRFES